MEEKREPGRPRRWPRLALTLVLAAALLGGGFLAGAAMDRAGALGTPPTSAPESAQATFGVFWQAWNLVQQHYVHREAVDPTKMTYGAISGMLASLGDVGHTRFLDPSALRQEQQALSGQLEGIGAQLGVQDGHPTIVAPIPGSPAQKAGLRTGDLIIRVDGKDVAGLELEQVVQLIRGPAGTSVTLTIIHRNETTLNDITITRARITVPNVTWTMLPGTTVAHVLISQFGERATDDLQAALKSARDGGARALILDLRNDPGGLRDEAIGVASQFLGEGNVLIEVDAEGHRTNYPVRPGGVALDIPMVTLINAGTASSAEIVAGALQDYQRGQLVGETTVGTGTVLTPYRLNDGSAVWLGTSEWLTPKGRQIWHHGIDPDITVTLPPGATPALPNVESGMTAEQFRSTSDSQLLRALEVVSSGGR